MRRAMSQMLPNTRMISTENSTWFFSCKKDVDQKEFEIFQRADISITTFAVFSAISSAITFYFKIRIFEYNASNFNLFSLIFGVFFELILGFGLLFYLNFYRHNQSKHNTSLLSFMENLFVTTLSISRILTITTFLMNGQCSSGSTHYNNIQDSAACGSGSQYQMPEGLMALLLVYPMLLSMIVKSVKSESVFFCWLITVISLIIVFIVKDFHLSLTTFVAISMISFLKLYEFQRQKISMFILSQELRGSQTENERLEKENRASELKHLIGNVAHDLKTPLSSLNMGIDLITTVLEETSSLVLNASEELKNNLHANICFIEEHLQNMRNVNAFMLMNINRCMDYTKATNGLKLVPHIETAPLIETIALPLHVMNAMQGGKTHISLLPVPKDICGHIITDKQWLEENILCLLSNAVKYSHKGEITVSVSKVFFKTEVEALTDEEELDLQLKPDFESKEKPIRSSSPVPAPHISKIISPNLSIASIGIDDDPMSPRTISVTVDSGGEYCCTSPRGIVSSVSDFLRIEVEDTGIGLSDEVMRSLFSPFKQAQRLAGGTGLGLFSLSRRVDAIGGRYGVMRRRDGQQGSVFWFDIPYKPDLEYLENMLELSIHSAQPVAYFGSRESQKMSKASQKIRRASLNPPIPLLVRSSMIVQAVTKQPSSLPLVAAPAVSEPNSPQKQIGSPGASSPVRDPLNILLVDDTLSIQKMTRMLLQKQGHTVTIAENGVEALELITANYDKSQRGGFDVVLMDFQMPIMDGLEATRRIRLLEAQLWEKGKQQELSMHSISVNSHTTMYRRGKPTFHQLIIGLSANSDDETVQLARSEGLDDFMEKPFKAAIFNEIYDRINRK